MTTPEEALFAPAKVVVVDGLLTINEFYPYQIDMSRLRNKDDLLAWVMHLTEKTWMTHELMREFIYVAAGAAEIKLPELPQA